MSNLALSMSNYRKLGMKVDHVHGSHDTLLVIFSYIVAAAASFTVLNLVGIIASLKKAAVRWLWLLFGAAVMGTGIWSMHFIGMMAFSLPVPIAYDMVLVVLSVIFAIAASFIALYVVARDGVTLMQVLGSGAVLGAGISAMHYVGMAAMQVEMHYNAFWVAVSIVIAFAASNVALLLSVYFRKAGGSGDAWKKIGSALMMGVAVAGMHYTGMAAVSFDVHHLHGDADGLVLDQKWLAYFIAAGTLFTIGLSIAGVVVSRRFMHKDEEIDEKNKEIILINQELRELNDHLEDLVAERTAQLAQAHDEAIHANMVKSQFLANMSHELRTPLNAIIGYSEMLAEEAHEMGNSMFVEDLGKISKAGNHLLTLINDILDISKIEAGKMELYFESTDVRLLGEEVLATISPIAKANGNHIAATFADGEMVTDVTRLRQILLNLLSNASKFTKDGKITLAVAAEERDGRPGYSFQVRDTGIGMAAEEVERLFQPFMQADSSTTRKYGGTGLGLAISHRFCSLLGGAIDVDSEPGAGSVFTCWLPAAPPSNRDGASEAAQLWPWGDEGAGQGVAAGLAGQEEDEPKQVHILLIDDDPINHQLMSRYLLREGWNVAYAHSGQDGLKLARKLRPLVICLDILMPSMDGWSVLSELKEDPELEPIPVIIWSMASDRHLGYALGASEYLTKPVQRERLIHVLDKYVTPGRTDQYVLVVEDDKAASELLARLLHREGYPYEQAGNGRLALGCMEQRVPALVLLDLMMPEMDGFQFLDNVRSRKEWHDIPVVVITAKTVTEEDWLKLSGFVHNVIQKAAFDQHQLLDEIRLLLKGK